MRNIATIQLFTLLLAAVLGTSIRGAAQNNPGQAKPETPKSDTAKPKSKADSETRPRGKPFTGQLGAVDKVNKTITIKGKEKDRTVQITSSTRLTREGKPAVLGDAVVGEEVAGFWKESADGKLEALSVRLGAKAPRLLKPKKEKQEKEEK